jgi:hypothetical protein
MPVSSRFVHDTTDDQLELGVAVPIVAEQDARALLHHPRIPTYHCAILQSRFLPKSNQRTILRSFNPSLTSERSVGSSTMPAIFNQMTLFL